MRTTDMVFACKKCKKVFRKDVSEFEEADEYCPRCDNQYIIPAKTPETEGKMVVQIDQKAGHEHKMFKDMREKQRQLALDDDLDF
mmetsp:Transcript_67805/g.93893  ORF Transcript_67805/g.93893 Transcript_67805/m.93893 type:complete len:85 (+) Transcript_67805:157-411(+)